MVDNSSASVALVAPTFVSMCWFTSNLVWGVSKPSNSVCVILGLAREGSGARNLGLGSACFSSNISSLPVVQVTLLLRRHASAVVHSSPEITALRKMELSNINFALVTFLDQICISSKILSPLYCLGTRTHTHTHAQGVNSQMNLYIVAYDMGNERN